MTWRTRLLAALDSERPVRLASAFSLIAGLFFIFVWSPLPFGWLGIDHYDDRALKLAAGEPFDTTDVPWGYAYYLAFFYLIFGHHPWIPLVFQVALNAAVPFLLYHLVRPLADRRTAVLSAALAGVFSFNTIYTSTQSSDAVCTVLFLLSLLLFDRGRREQRPMLFAASGLAVGLATQFRPNLLLFPPLLAAAYVVVRPRLPGKVRDATAFVALVVLALLPWVVRNYRLTGEFLPTSTHGGYQLWLGTLESWPYLERRPDNPRKVFDAPAFDYTSIEHRPIEVTALASDCGSAPRLVYWTDRDRTPRRIEPAAPAGGRNVRYVIPAQPSPTAVYYEFDSPEIAATPGAEDRPSVFFVSTDHFGDLDRHGDVADVFDVIRLLRYQAWNEPLADATHWDLTGDGRITDADTRALIDRLASAVDRNRTGGVVAAIDIGAESVAARLTDGSILSVPHIFSGRITDLDVRGDLAGKLVYARQQMKTLLQGPPPMVACGAAGDVAVNDAFYRREPHWMRRYTALAMDNIGRNPIGFAVASLYRVGRVFIIRGSSDAGTAQQFTSSRVIYAIGLLVSLGVFAVFLRGVVLAWRQRSAVLWLLLPILYVPLTICFVLTNMRYSITVQPLIFVFVAIALVRIASSAPPAPQR
jgi:hypothetical protein